MGAATSRPRRLVRAPPSTGGCLAPPGRRGRPPGASDAQRARGRRRCMAEGALLGRDREAARAHSSTAGANRARRRCATRRQSRLPARRATAPRCLERPTSASNATGFDTSPTKRSELGERRGGREALRSGRARSARGPHEASEGQSRPGRIESCAVPLVKRSSAPNRFFGRRAPRARTDTTPASRVASRRMREVSRYANAWRTSASVASSTPRRAQSSLRASASASCAFIPPRWRSYSCRSASVGARRRWNAASSAAMRRATRRRRAPLAVPAERHGSGAARNFRERADERAEGAYADD